MAEKVLQSKFEEELSCSICLGTFTDPKVLQCCHIFCQQCLARLVGRSQHNHQVSCPNCRQATPIPGANGTASLPPAVHIRYLVEMLTEHKIAAEKLDSEKKYCCSPEHEGKEVNLYCETCEELICWNCGIKGGNHYTHDCYEPDKAVQRYKDGVKALLEPIEEELARIMGAFEAHHEKTSKKRENVKADIRKNINQLHEILNSRQAELLEQVDRMSEDRLKELEDQRQKLKVARAEVEDLQSGKNMEGSDISILIKKGRTLDQVKNLVTVFQSDTYQPKVDHDIEFSKTAKVAAQCESYGKVSLIFPPKTYRETNEAKPIQSPEDRDKRLVSVVKRKPRQDVSFAVKPSKKEYNVDYGGAVDVGCEEEMLRPHRRRRNAMIPPDREWKMLFDWRSSEPNSPQ